MQRRLTGTGRTLARRFVLVATGVVAALSVIAASPSVASAQDDVDAAQRLVERFAPVVVVREQAAPCDTDGEPFEPAPVEIVLDNPEVFLRQVGNDDPVLMSAPGAADIFDLREGWYLDFPGDALEPGCVFEQDFRRFFDGRSVVYAHVATEAGRPGMLAVQYWLFWYHNPAKNDHEGDWEFVQLLFDVGTVEEALATEPVSVGYAQHVGGERSDWDDRKLDKDGDRPVVYAAQGSHASYFGQALYLGRSGAEGFGCDNTDEPSRRLDPDVVLLPDRVDDPDGEFAWLAFQGRWGQREAGFFNGPTGPYAKQRWVEPVTWSEGLRDSSVVIPAGDRFGAGVLNTFCGAVEFGSTLLVVALRSPLSVLLLLTTVLVVVVVLARRTRWSPVETRPVVAERRSGQVLRCAIRAWRDDPVTMLKIGLVYVPISIVTAILQVILLNVPWVDDLLDLAGARSGVAAVFAVFVGSIGNLLAFTIVTMMVARVMDHSAGGEVHGAGVLPPTEQLRSLVRAVARAAVIVIALLVSVVGIPWGIRQVVRYQMTPMVIALEGSGARPALRRSTDLVRGRWWWTAGIIVIVQATVAIAGVGSALVILLSVTSIPLWLFNVLSSVIYVVLVPVGAAAMVYVYGGLAMFTDEDVPVSTSDDLSGHRVPNRS